MLCLNYENNELLEPRKWSESYVIGTLDNNPGGKLFRLFVFLHLSNSTIESLDLSFKGIHSEHSKLNPRPYNELYACRFQKVKQKVPCVI